VQSVSSIDSSVASGTTTTPFDDTIPQNTEGNQFMSKTITPSSAANILETSHFGNYSSSVLGPYTIVALFQDAIANALAAAMDVLNAADARTTQLRNRQLAGGTAATTFKVRAGLSGAGTITFNGVTAARKMGGVLQSNLAITEIMA
jgi:hypothetical protein